MIKDILVYVDNSSQCSSRVQSTINLACRFNADITGLYADDWTQRIVMMAPEIVPAITESQKKLWEQRESSAKNTFTELTAATNLSTHWASAEGDVTDTIARYSHTKDLVVLSQHDKDDPKLPEYDIMHSVLLSTSCPNLVLPNNDVPFGNRILIAWDASKESARAIRDSLPLLKQAEYVELISISFPSGFKSEIKIDTQAIVNHLQKHDINAKSENVESYTNAGESIINYVNTNKFDLVVMGAYGHSRLREIVLAGTSRHVLKHSPVALFMSH